MTQTSAQAVWTSNSNAPISPPTLLLVDDDRTIVEMLRSIFTSQGYHLLSAQTGEEGLRLMAEHAARINAVVLDREMPGMGGMAVVSQMKKDPQLAAIPIIMLTVTGVQEKIQEGIDTGVYYYLIKPVDNALLRSIVASALRESRQKQALVTELNRYGTALKALNSCHISVRTLKEAEDTACFLGSCFPDPERVATGLMELLVNAVEHGNLGITYDEKTELLAQNRWREEIDRRVILPEYASKTAEVTFQRKNGTCLAQITDSGPGFDWRRYWHINPARASASNGRGIARARLMAFDRISYNDKGNSVTIMVSEKQAPASDYAW